MTREEWLLERSVNKAAEDTGLHPNVIRQVIQHESSGNPNAQSPTGPQGLMQLSKAAAIEGGIDPSQRFDIQKNVGAGANYYKQQVDKFGADKAYAAYHDGPTAVLQGKPVSTEGNWVPAQPTREEFLANLHNGMEHLANTNVIPEVLGNELKARARGPEALARYNKYSKLAAPAKMLVAAGLPAIKMADGFNELSYNLAGMSGVPGMQDKVNHIADRQKALDTQYKEFNENSGMPGVVGGMLPYIVNGQALGPMLGKGAEAVLKSLSSVPAEGVTAGKGLFSQLVNRMAVSGYTPVKNVGRAVKRVATDPWAKTAAEKAAQVTLSNPYTKGLGGEILGSTALGALEGGLHYDQTMGQGAVSGLMGALPGVLMKPGLVKIPDFREGNATEKELLDWGRGKGMQYTPGMETGSIRLQNFDRAMQAPSSMFADKFARFKQGNAIVENRIAADAMGLDTTVRNKAGLTVLDAKGNPKLSENVSFTPTTLSNHLDNLGKEYDALEAGTVPVMAMADRKALQAHVDRLKQDGTTTGKSIYADAADYMKRLNQNVSAFPTRDPLTGRLQIPAMSGTNFQDMRSKLKNDISGAYKSGDKNRAESLKPILKALDDAANKGVEVGRGTAAAAQWKDVNERYAMTNLIMNHGMTDTGQFNPIQLRQHLMGDDASRMLTDIGKGRISPLYKVSKLAYMDKEQKGSDLAGMGVKGIKNREKPSLAERLLMTPAAGYVDSFAPIPSFLLNQYLKGYPVKKGLLAPGPLPAWSGEGFGRPSLYTRALGMSIQPYPRIYNSVENGVNDVKDAAGNMRNRIKDFLFNK